MPIYKLRPPEVSAVQYITGKSLAGVFSNTGTTDKKIKVGDKEIVVKPTQALYSTNEGIGVIESGDYIITHSDGRKEHMPQVEFEKLYELK